MGTTPKNKAIDAEYLLKQLKALNTKVFEKTYSKIKNAIFTGSFSHNRKAGTTIGTASFAEGFNTTASGGSSHAEGDNTIASGEYSHAEGANTEASGYFAHAEGSNTTASGMNSHAEGDNTEASGHFAHAEGSETIASGDFSHAEGGMTKASGYFSHAEGESTTASGNNSHTEGSNTVAGGNNSHAEGSNTTASGDYSHAEGNNTIANGESQHVQGKYNIADETSAFIIGNGSSDNARSNAMKIDWGGNLEVAGDLKDGSGNTLNKMMSKTNPTGTGSFSLNRKANTTIGDSSFAEGANTTASGSASHAEGRRTIASGAASHAEGGVTTASGPISHAEGSGTTASGDFSHAEGYYTKAANHASHASGKYNTAMTTGGASSNTIGTAFVIGNGTSSSALSNAFSVQFDGTVKAKSTITASTTADYAEFFEWLDKNPNEEDRVGHFVTLDGDKIKIATSEDDYILGIVSGEPFVLGNGDCDTWNGMYLHDEFRRTMYEPAPKMIEILDSEGNPTGEYEEVEGEYEGTRPILNPDYDPTQEYVSRFDRVEWSPVGMLGVLAVLHDGTAEVNGYVTVNDEGIATKCTRDTSNSYRVIKKISDKVVEVIFR